MEVFKMKELVGKLVVAGILVVYGKTMYDLGQKAKEEEFNEKLDGLKTKSKKVLAKITIGKGA